jgi:hypothetical protein
MKYELWANKDKTSSSFFEAECPDHDQKLQMLRDEDNAFELIWTTEAEHWEGAMQKYYDFMDWGKYRPINE